MSGKANATNPSNFGRVKRATSAFASFQAKSSPSPNHQNGAYANLYTSPVPAVREIVQSTFTSFCEFHRGRRARTSRVTTSVFIKNVLAIMQREDKKVAILSYDEQNPVNSICHPNQVPDDMDLFQKYFPRAYSSKGTLTVKCRITSSMDIHSLKRQVMPSLEKYDYFIWPSQLKAVRTGKIGWLYLAHPDLTHRGEIVQVLSPIIKQHFNKEMEFQAVPEFETVTVNEKVVKQRVLTIRCSHDSLEDMRAFFTEAFAADSNMHIQYLARYTFVSNHPIGNVSWSHLQAVLEMQKVFHKNVHWFNLFGVTNVDQEFALASKSGVTSENILERVVTQADNASPQSQDDTNMLPAVPEDQEMPPSEDHDASSNPMGESNGRVPETSPPRMSLRFYMYNKMNSDNHNMIHAVYKSADDKKLFVLCSQTNKQETLSFLHNIESTISEVFEPEALPVYVPKSPNGKGPYVKDYPKMTSRYTTYVNNLIDLTSSVNPQDDTPIPPATSYANAVTPNKRHHSGAPKETIYKSNLPVGFNESRQQNIQLTSTVNETISRLKTVETNAVENTETLNDLSGRLDRATQDISEMGAALQTQSESLAEVQKAHIVVQKEQQLQGVTMHAMKSEQTQILDMLRQLVATSAAPSNGRERGSAS